MGTDTAGKQEIDPGILAGATVFSDEIAQSVSIGECQHAIAQGLIAAADITVIGEVINGTHPGRSRPQQITVFDGTGVGLQDLAAAAACVRAAVAQNKVLTVEL
jgi:ornithine cyclodeaminase